MKKMEKRKWPADFFEELSKNPFPADFERPASLPESLYREKVIREYAELIGDAAPGPLRDE